MDGACGLATGFGFEGWGLGGLGLGSGLGFGGGARKGETFFFFSGDASREFGGGISRILIFIDVLAGHLSVEDQVGARTLHMRASPVPILRSKGFGQDGMVLGLWYQGE